MLRADAIDDYIRAELKRQGVPGMSLGVVRDGKTLKAEGYGLANVEHDVPAARHTVYQSGSVGKQFTAAAVMLLIEDGKLALEDPIALHLPGAPEAWNAITVRHLLTHTSGLGDYIGALDMRRDYSEDELLRKAYGIPPISPPGREWRYSNTGYMLLGVLVSKLSGKFYGEVLRERVFNALFMKTARVMSEADIVPNRAAGYRWADGALRNQEWVAPSINTSGDGSLYLSVDDLIKWNIALDSEAVLKKASLKKMWEPGRTADGKPTGYGFGWFIDEVHGHRRLHHGGAWQGFTSHVERYPDHRLAVIVLMNMAGPSKPGEPGGDPARIAAAVAALVEPALRGPTSRQSR